LLRDRGSRKQLPDGLIARLVGEAQRAGLKLGEREIQYRIKLATVYTTDQQVRTAVRTFGSWTALREAGFPAVFDEEDAEDLLDLVADVDVCASDVVEQQPLFELPGLKSTLKVNGRKVDLADATVQQVVDYKTMCCSMHDNFGRTVEQLASTVETMLKGCGGDLDANALEAWQRGASA
jgi:hypothetical protein